MTPLANGPKRENPRDLEGHWGYPFTSTSSGTRKSCSAPPDLLGNGWATALPRSNRVVGFVVAQIEYFPHVSTMECPKCFLPKEDSAWQCDGCGHEFSQDFENVRSTLRVQLRTSHIGFWVTLFVGLGIVGGLVYLAMHGWIYISVPLMLVVVGGIGHAAHRISVLRGHLRLLDRRHVPLPKATVQGP
jgi:hypothetical protein